MRFVSIVLSTMDHEGCLMHALPLLLPVTGTTDICILNVLSLYPNYLTVGLSFLLNQEGFSVDENVLQSHLDIISLLKQIPFPYAVKTYIILIMEYTVIVSPSNDCFEINILPFAFALKFPDRF